jgi:hypothetical protein
MRCSASPKTDCIRGCIRPVVPQPTEWQHIGDEIGAAMIFAWADFVDVCSPWHRNGIQSHRTVAVKRAGNVDDIRLDSESSANHRRFWRDPARRARQVGATLWFNRQGQAHIISTAIRLPRSYEPGPDVGTSFFTDPQPASISPTVNISIVFICAVLDCGGIIHHPAIKNDSSAIPEPTEWQHVGDEIDAAMILARADFVNVD